MAYIFIPSAPPPEDFGEFDEINNLFTTVLGSSSKYCTILSIFSCVFSDAAFVDMDQLKMDEEMAKMLAQIDQDTNSKIKKMEEEDRKLAEMLAMQESR